KLLNSSGPLETSIVILLNKVWANVTSEEMHMLEENFNAIMIDIGASVARGLRIIDMVDTVVATPVVPRPRFISTNDENHFSG
ncbi:hypothetical protein TNCV_4506741, partial [Trichonephila clavipes]